MPIRVKKDHPYCELHLINFKLDSIQLTSIYVTDNVDNWLFYRMPGYSIE